MPTSSSGNSRQVIEQLINLWCVADEQFFVPDCIVGLSYALLPDGKPTPMTKTMLDKIVTLHNKYPQIKVIVATGDNQHLGVSNAKLMKVYLVKMKIPEKIVIEEDKSSNTYENILNVNKLLIKNNLHQPILVTYDLHMRRSLATVDKFDITYSWTSATTSDVAMGKRKQWQLNRASMMIYEVGATLLSKILGWA